MFFFFSFSVDLSFFLPETIIIIELAAVLLPFQLLCFANSVSLTLALCSPTTATTTLSFSTVPSKLSDCLQAVTETYFQSTSRFEQRRHYGGI